MKPAHPSQRKPQQGIVLIEALVGILIFSVGVLGLVGLQASMTKAQTGSKLRADAANLSQELIGVMWSDSEANLPNYATASCDGYPRCKDWKQKLQKQLPAGDATATVNALTGEVAVVIVWTQPSEGQHRHETSAMVQIANTP